MSIVHYVNQDNIMEAPSSFKNCKLQPPSPFLFLQAGNHIQISFKRWTKDKHAIPSEKVDPSCQQKLN